MEIPADEVLDRLSDELEAARIAGGVVDPKALALRLGIDPQVVVALHKGNEALELTPGVLQRLLGEGRYVARGVISKGGMGAVYRAWDTRLERDVAIKVLLAGCFAKPAQRERFLREARAAAQLRHPNALAIYDLGALGEDHYLVLEFVDGARTLDEVVPEWGWRERVLAIRDAARAVGQAHRRGLIHRDLKPENVLVDGCGEVRVVDFGLARSLDAAALTASGAIVGTMGYLSPEQAGGKSAEQGPTTDVWSLGVLLYEALAGARPYEGTMHEFLAALHTRRAPTPLRTLAPELPPRLEAICARALAFERDARYPNADALADALDSVLDESAPASGGLSRAHLALACAISAGVGALAAGLSFAAPRPDPAPSPVVSVAESPPLVAPSESASPQAELAPLASSASLSVEHAPGPGPVGTAFSIRGRLVTYGLGGLKHWYSGGRRHNAFSPGTLSGAVALRKGDWIFATSRQLVRRTIFRARGRREADLSWEIPVPLVYLLAAAPSTQRVAFVAEQGGVHCVGAGTGVPELLCKPKERVRGLTFVDEVLLLVHVWTAGGSRLELWDTVSKLRRAVLEGPRVTSAATSPEGRSIALGYASGRLAVYGTDLTQARVLSDPGLGQGAFVGALGPLVFTPERLEGSVLYASPGSDVLPRDRRIKRFVLPGGELRALTPPLPAPPSALTLGPKGRVLAVGFSDGRAELWPLPDR